MQILHVFETITINGKTLPCKIDTGAFSSSIVSGLATDMTPFNDGSDKFFRTINGRESRERVISKVILGGIEIEIVFSVTDRSKMKFPVLIGRRSLKGVTIVPTDDECDPSNPINVTKLT